MEWLPFSVLQSPCGVLNKLIAFWDKKIIKVITRVRRCGKSTLMQIYQDYLRENGVEEKCIISVNLEDYDYCAA